MAAPQLMAARQAWEVGAIPSAAAQGKLEATEDLA